MKEFKNYRFQRNFSFCFQSCELSVFWLLLDFAETLALLQIFSTSVRSVSLLMLSSFPSFKMSQKSFPLLFALSVHVDAFTSLAWSTVFLFDLKQVIQDGCVTYKVGDLGGAAGLSWAWCNTTICGDARWPYKVFLVLERLWGSSNVGFTFFYWSTAPLRNMSRSWWCEFVCGGHLNFIVCEVCTAMQENLRGFCFTHFLFLWYFSSILNLKGWYLNLRF